MDIRSLSFLDEYRDVAAEVYASIVRLHLLEELAISLWTRFQQNGNQQDLDWVIALHRLLIDTLPHDFPDRWAWLKNLAMFRSVRYDKQKCLADLQRAIVLRREVVAICPREHEQYCNLLECLAMSLYSHFEVQGKVEDLNEAIKLQRTATTLISEGHPDHPTSLATLASFLLDRFQRIGNPKDLAESITFFQAAISLLPESHPNRPSTLHNLASSFAIRFQQSGSMSDLEEAVRLHRDTLALHPHGHPNLSALLNNLANSLMTRYEKSSSMDDLNEAIQLHRDALALRPHEHLNRSSSLSSLAKSLMTRFEQRGSVDDLNEAIQLHRDALDLYPHGHPKRSMSLSDLAIGLRKRFEQCGSVDDLNEAVRLHRDALALRPHGHPNHSVSLNNLAASLQSRFRRSGSVNDLNEAVQLHRDSLALRPHGDPHRSSSLSNLALGLMTRFEQSGSVDDLDEAIQLHRDALDLRPHGHPNQLSSLNNLAVSLMTRFQQSGSANDLNEAVQLHRDTLDLYPRGHPGQSMSLNNLANGLQMRFQQYGNVDDLSEAVQLYRDALALRPRGHPDCSSIMINISISLYARFQKLGHGEDFEECVQLLMRATDHTFSAMLTRFDAAYHWARITRLHGHSTTLAAYRTAISLLQRALAIRPDLSTRHDLLKGKQRYQTLGMDAASYAIEKGDLPAAIELLEQGRALLWSQMRGFRTPLDQLMELNQPLAQRFRQIGNQLEVLMTSSEKHAANSGLEEGSSGIYNRRREEERMERVQRLAAEQEELISKIREVSGFEDFLQAASFEKLQRAASEGPVIVINHSDFRCDALIMLSRRDVPCVCVPLDDDWRLDATYLHQELVEGRSGRRINSASFDEALRRVMKALWDRVVSKVVEKLRELRVPNESRIWWCPTSILSMFPFHAAGPYQSENGGMRYLLDDYVSSYTPTLTSLIAARTNVRVGTQKLLFVGDSSLRSTKKEYLNIRKHSTVWKCLVDEKASRDSVLKSLKRAEWVHFTCHGSLDMQRPFESSFALPGGKLTLLDLSRAHLQNAEFAFLSACHSAEQPYSSAIDEALHLAAAIQFCGFRSVVGTMWQLLDRDGPAFADAVYAHFFNDMEEEEVKFKGAAAAVRRAALSLKSRKELADGGVEEVEISAERWVNLVHIGA